MKKKILIGLIVLFVGLPLLAVLGVRLGWSSYFEPRVRSAIVEIAGQQGYELKLKPVVLKSWWLPLQLQIQDVEVQNQRLGLAGKVARISLLFEPKTWTTDPAAMDGAVTLQLVQPQLTLTQTLEMQKSELSAQSEATTPEETAASIPPLKVDVSLREGQFVFNQETKNGYNQVALMQAEGTFLSSALLQDPPAELQIQGSLVYKILNAPFPLEGRAPLSLASKNLQLTSGGLKTEQAVLSLGGLQVTLQGHQRQGSQSWKVQTEVADIGDLQKGGLLPAGTWKGGLIANLELQKEENSAPLIQGRLQLQKLRGVLTEAIKKQGVQISGGFAIQGVVDFQQQDILKSLQANMVGNLTSLNLFKEDLFFKKAGVPFTFALQSKLKGKNIELSQVKVRLAQIQSQISGLLATSSGEASRLKIQLPKTDLTGLETLFLPMKQYPAKGKVALQAEISGDLQKPESLQIQANPIDLQIRSGLRMQDKTNSYLVKGPFQAQMKGRLSFAGKEVKQAQLVGKANLDAMTIRLKSGLEKKAKQKLNLVFNGGKKGKVFNFSQFDADTFFGDFKMKGSLSNPLKPQLNLSGRLSNLDLVALKSLFKSFNKLPVQGQVNGAFKIQGLFDPKLGLEKSPIKISGEMLHNSSLLRWTSPKTNEVGAKDENAQGRPSQEANKPQPLLPDWPLVKTAELAVVSKIKKVIFNDLIVTDFHLKGRYDKGILTGQMSMNRLFSGNLVLKDIRSDLYQVPTYIQGTALTKGLNLQQAVTWGMPAQKDLVKGRLTGGFKVKTPFPSHADPLQKTVSSGTLTIQGFEVSTLKLDQMINGLLQKIPGLKDKKKVSTKDVKALFKTRYVFKDGVLSYQETDFLTPENHQLLANGTLHADQSIRLKGDLMVSGVKVKDRLANCLLDSQGRLKVPVEYVGSIVAPKVSNSAKVIEKIGGRYLECEKKSQLKKAKGEVKKEADKLLKKEGKKLENKLKDKLKDIF